MERLVHELFAYYERYHWFDRLRCEREKLGIIADGVARRESSIQALVHEAMRPVSPEVDVAQTVVALTDFTVWKALTASAMSTSEAAERVTAVLLAWLSDHKATPTRSLVL